MHEFIDVWIAIAVEKKSVFDNVTKPIKELNMNQKLVFLRWDTLSESAYIVCYFKLLAPYYAFKSQNLIFNAYNFKF